MKSVGKMTVQVAAHALIVITLCGIGLVHSIDHGRPSPVLIISGYTGSNLYVQDETDTNCNTNGETIKLWINGTHRELLPDCFINQMKLTYSDGRYSDAEDVTISTSDFGKLSSLIDLTDILPNAMNQPNAVDYLVERGYVIDKSVRAAPYDWRLGADELNQRGFYINLKQLVEQMYEENGNTKVTLVVISMDGPVSLYFLTQVVNQEWKDTYIHSYVPLDAAWSAANGLYSLFTPPPISLFLGAYEINADVEELRDLYRSFASNYFLLPHESVWNDMILLSTPTNNYTASDYQQLFTDAGYPQGYTRVRHRVNQFPSPNVPTYCFYGLRFPTVETAVYGDGFPDTQPTFVFGEGDGIINKASLEVCQQWANSGYPFNRTIFQGYDHFNITYDIAILESIRDIIGAPVDPLDVCELPVDQGPCHASIPRYFFNPKKGVCEKFTYGGCNGNSNNFEMLEECNQRCNPNGCPPICTQDYCSNVNTRRSLCTLPSPRGDCDAKCRITYCHTCYYADEHRPLPGDCDTCSYYPEVRQAVNKCFKRWAVCTRRANGQQYTKARGRKQRRPDRFKCYEHPCV